MQACYDVSALDPAKRFSALVARIETHAVSRWNCSGALDHGNSAASWLGLLVRVSTMPLPAIFPGGCEVWGLATTCITDGVPRRARGRVGESAQTTRRLTKPRLKPDFMRAHALKIREPHVITVTGKAFYDIGHAPADHSNRRSTPKGYAVGEIHWVMKMEVIP